MSILITVSELGPEYPMTQTGTTWCGGDHLPVEIARIIKAQGRDRVVKRFHQYMKRSKLSWRRDLSFTRAKLAMLSNVVVC